MKQKDINNLHYEWIKELYNEIQELKKRIKLTGRRRRAT